ADLKLVTGGSGVAMGLPANFGSTPGTPDWQGHGGPALALSGSCSIATRAQVAYHAKDHPVLEIRAEDIVEARMKPAKILEWALAEEGVPLVYSSAEPEVVKAVQNRFGREVAAAAIETFFAELARLAVAKGVTRIITAGGETSGAVVEALDIDEMRIGPEIDPGVPALRVSPHLAVALKSGNFGAEDFFQKAAGVLGP
ncbi:MAG: nucleotide-binding domain containing protein, partial [Pseudomonadota bacterium]